MKRRNFIKNASLTSVGIVVGSTLASCKENTSEEKKAITPAIKTTFPLVIGTWNVKRATATASEALEQGAIALDGIEQGCKIEEADEKNQTVGKGGLPDRDGHCNH